MAELKPCPFCGETQVSIRYAILNGETLVSCVCDFCGVELPVRETIGKAVWDWNTREGKHD